MDIARVLGRDSFHEQVVDEVGDFQVSWEEVAEEFDAPFFEGFLHDGVIGVSKDLVNQRPGKVPIEMI